MAEQTKPTAMFAAIVLMFIYSLYRTVQAKTTGATCKRLVGSHPDMDCHDLLEPPGVYTVTYDPKKEHIASEPGNYLKEIYAIVKREFGTAKTGQRMLDIGGNQGYFTMSVASLGYKVYTFEPGEQNFKRIYAGVAVNGFMDRVTVLPFGLGGVTGVTQVFLNPDNAVLKSDGIVMTGKDDPVLKAEWKVGNWFVSNIMVTTLDDFAQSKRGLADVVAVKMDVEGFESMVISGGKEFFSRVKPRMIFMEMNEYLWKKRSGSPHYMAMDETLRFLVGIGYSILEQGPFSAGASAPALSVEDTLAKLKDVNDHIDVTLVLGGK